MKQVYVSDEAYDYVKQIQAKLMLDKKESVSMASLISQAILNNVKEGL